MLPAIRFAPNTAKCEPTDNTAAYLTFIIELRTLDQFKTDLRSVMHNGKFVTEFTPYLKRFEGYMSHIKENIEMSQDRQKTYENKSRRPSPKYKVNDLVGVAINSGPKNPKDLLKKRRVSRHKISHYFCSCQLSDKPDEPLGVYHTSGVTPFLNGTETQSPVVPLN
ncbi:retrovirus-related Pol polyprotein from transposon 412 [Trichonephila clavipes]|nr:retrovirus-related Pol polyprotein from transposon 412 [Trichonephila clavipes]